MGRRQTETYPLPATVDEVVARIGSILAGGGVEFLSLNIGEPIFVERWIDSDGFTPEVAPPDPDLVELTLSDMSERVTLAEYVPVNEEASPAAQLFEMFMIIGSGKYVPTHVLCASKQRLKRWLHMEHVILESEFRIAGARVEEDHMLPPDVVIVFGSRWFGAPASEVKVGLKLSVGGFDVRPQADRQPVREERHRAEGPGGLSGAAGGSSEGDSAPTWFGAE